MKRNKRNQYSRKTIGKKQHTKLPDLPQIDRKDGADFLLGNLSEKEFLKRISKATGVEFTEDELDKISEKVKKEANTKASKDKGKSVLGQLLKKMGFK